MTDIQILFDGHDITADVRYEDARFSAYAGGQAGEVEIRVRDKTHVYGPGYFHAGGTLELFIDGRREWDGWAMVVGREWAFDVDITENAAATPRYWVLEGYDRNLLFSRRFHFDQSDPPNFFIGDYPAGAVDQDVVRDVLANYTPLQTDGLDIYSGIELVGPIDPWEKINVMETGMPWGTFMSQISLFNGAVFYLDPDRVVRYVDDVTATAPFALSDEATAGEIGYRELLIHFDANTMANDVLMWGVGVGNPAPVFSRTTDEAAIAEHGRFQYAEPQVQGIYVQKSIDRRTDTYVNGSPLHHRGHKEDIVRIECVIYEPGLRVGMGVGFHSGAWDLGAANYTYDPTDLNYVPGNYDKSTEFERLLFQIGKIESHNNYTSQNHRSFAYGYWQFMPANWAVWGPLALGLPRSVGVAARYIDPANWYPPPTPQNQNTVVRWRMGAMYNNKGHDPRRVAASWRSGPGVGSREPSTWSRGTLLYVNHACMPLGYPETTATTVLDPLGDPTQDWNDYQTPTNVDDVYPVRKMEMTFPTPTSVRYALMLSHSYDAPWGYKDPLPTGKTSFPTGFWFQETITLGGGIGGGPPGGGSLPPAQPAGGLTFHLFVDYGIREGTDGVQHGAQGFLGSAGMGVYSAAGIQKGFASNLGWPHTDCGVGFGGWTKEETAEAWYKLPSGLITVGYDANSQPVKATLAEINALYPLEITIGPGNASGYCPGLDVAYSTVGPTTYLNNRPVGASALDAGTLVAHATNYNNELFGEYGTDTGPSSIAVGTISDASDADNWLIVKPSWRASAPNNWLCDIGYLYPQSPCAARGPRCTGQLDSGVYTLTGGPEVTVKVIGWPAAPGAWTQQPGPGSQNGVGVYANNGLYRTFYPYQPGSLSGTWEGVALTKGVEIIEIDPGLGTFQISDVGTTGSITIKYWVPPNAAPTPPLPGEGGGDTPSGSAAIEAVIAQAYSMLGVPYKLGAESRTETDCSGLVFRCFEDAGEGALIDNRRLLAAGYTNFFANKGMFTRNIASAQRGDLIAYSPDGIQVKHIAIYLGGGMIISALINPLGVSKTRLYLTEPGGGALPIYGVCMVPYDSVRTSTDTTTGNSDSTTEDPISTTSDLPPQGVPAPTGLWYRPRSQYQLGWGTQFDGYNGLMACSAMLLERQTLGAYNDIVGTPLSNPPAHRTYSGNTSFLPLTFADVTAAWSNGWGETLTTTAPVTWDSFKTSLSQGRGAIVLGHTSGLPDGLKQSLFTGTYALYINELLSDGSFWGYDPLSRSALVYPESALQAFAYALNGDQRVYCAYSRRTASL